jgi:hypothetical protein
MNQKVEESRNGLRSAGGAEVLRQCLRHFVAFAGASSPVSSIDFDFWERWYGFCAKQVVDRDGGESVGWSCDYAQKVFGAGRNFVRLRPADEERGEVV